MKSNEHIKRRPVCPAWLHDNVTRFGVDMGELSRQQSGKSSGFKYCRNTNHGYSAKAYFTDVLKRTDQQFDDSRHRLLLRSFDNSDQLITEPERLMATLIHRDTVPLAYWVTLDERGAARQV
jgi:hypothetical protein